MNNRYYKMSKNKLKSNEMETENSLQQNREGNPDRFPTSVRSFYESFKESVIINAKQYSYYTSIVALIILLLVLYCNYSLLSVGGFFWIIVELILILFIVWQNTMIYLKL